MPTRDRDAEAWLPRLRKGRDTEDRHLFALTPRAPSSKGSVLEGWLSSTDRKVIGYLYLIASFGFFLIGGVMALLLFATPLFVGFTNVVMPLQIGAPDVAFPRLNLLSYYLFLFSGLILLLSPPGGGAA